MFCKNCNREIVPGHVFCTGCGAPADANVEDGPEPEPEREPIEVVAAQKVDPGGAGFEFEEQINLLKIYLRHSREKWFDNAVSLLKLISIESGNEIIIRSEKLSGGGDMAIRACQFILVGLWLDEREYVSSDKISEFMLRFFDAINEQISDVIEFNGLLKSFADGARLMTSVSNHVGQYITGKSDPILESMILVRVVPELVSFTNIAVAEAFGDAEGAREQIEDMKTNEEKQRRVFLEKDGAAE